MNVKIFKPKAKDIPYDLVSISKDLKQVKQGGNYKKHYVYFLSSKFGEVVYIGKTIDIESRPWSHTYNKEFKNVFIIESNKESYEKIEKYWQLKLIPKYCQDGYLTKPREEKEKSNIKSLNMIVDSLALNFLTKEKYSKKVKEYKEKYEKL